MSSLSRAHAQKCCFAHLRWPICGKLNRDVVLVYGLLLFSLIFQLVLEGREMKQQKIKNIDYIFMIIIMPSVVFTLLLISGCQRMDRTGGLSACVTHLKSATPLTRSHVW